MAGSILWIAGHILPHEDEDSSIHRDNVPDMCMSCHGQIEQVHRKVIEGQLWETEPHKIPVCVDCHGIHGIQSADDPNSPTFRANLLATCQRCHPDASDDFPSSWLSHYEPEFGTATVVWAVTWFYRILIPLVIGGMHLYVIVALTRRHRPEGGEHG